MPNMWKYLIFGLSATLSLLGCVDDEKLSAPEKILGADIYKTEFELHKLTMGLDHQVVGSKGRKLYRVIRNGNDIELLYEFSDPISGIHVTPELDMVISTDRDHRDPDSPCSIYLSGKEEEYLKESLQSQVLKHVHPVIFR